VIVVDANVAAKWYLPEVGTEAALELMDSRSRLFAPDLIRLEVLASITRCVRTGEAEREETKKRCGDWFRHLNAGAVSLIPEEDLLDDALILSLEIKHNLQDCLYLAAARRLDASLITADTKFHERAFPLDKRISILAGCERN
jgi:predicted nucleic acid-binding protein